VHQHRLFLRYARVHESQVLLDLLIRGNAEILDVQLQMLQAGHLDAVHHLVPQRDGGHDAADPFLLEPGHVLRRREAPGAGQLARHDPAEIAWRMRVHACSLTASATHWRGEKCRVAA
jgi:hypothetical protein